MVEPLRHRQTKEAATDTFSLQPPRHISTLPKAAFWMRVGRVRFTPNRDQVGAGTKRRLGPRGDILHRRK